jgi:hypothetical protein
VTPMVYHRLGSSATFDYLVLNSSDCLWDV